VNWDRLFEDLEGQLASEWEAERAVLDAESERLRIARLPLHTRLRSLSARRDSVVLDLADGRRVPGLVKTVGADWLACEPSVGGTSAARTVLLVPLRAVHGLSADHGALLDSLEDRDPTGSSLQHKASFGFVLRDLARRRIPLHVTTRNAGDVHGTIDRAGSDHLDLAVHDAGTARMASAVRGFRIIPFDAVVSVRLGADQVR